MKVNAISTISSVNNISFGNSKKHEKHNNVSVPETLSSNYVKVPVILLMAMSPLTEANSKTPLTEKPLTTQIAAAPNSEAESAPYVILPEAQEVQQAPLSNWGIFRNSTVKSVKSATVAGEPNRMVFTTTGNSNSIERIYLVSNNDKPSQNPFIQPFRVLSLVYHNIGADKEFCGVVVKKDVYDSDENYKGTIKTEKRIDDKSAQLIIDLLTNHTQWNNETSINFVEVSTPKLMPTEVY